MDTVGCHEGVPLCVEGRVDGVRGEGGRGRGEGRLRAPTQRMRARQLRRQLALRRALCRRRRVTRTICRSSTHILFDSLPNLGVHSSADGARIIPNAIYVTA